MTVRVLFFGILRDVVGTSQEIVSVASPVTLSALFDEYAARFPALREMSGSIVLARNQEFAAPTTMLTDDDEIAFLPPVSGGSTDFTHLIDEADSGNFFGLTRVSIDVAAIARRLVRGEDGAVVTFEGVVRNNTKGRPTRYLDYECYEAMALRVMAEIGREIAANHAIGRLAMAHRLGRMEIGETSVVVVATAPHRRPAFEAALEGINRLKKTVPIWKKEYFADGEVWVDGDWDDSIVRADTSGS